MFIIKCCVCGKEIGCSGKLVRLVCGETVVCRNLLLIGNCPKLLPNKQYTHTYCDSCVKAMRKGRSLKPLTKEEKNERGKLAQDNIK